MTAPLTFVHLSDIHFHKRRSAGDVVGDAQRLDVDSDLRNEVERDLATLIPTIKPVTGVLVTGDIAYHGDKREFDLAADWLRKLCSIAGCREEMVWVVPGNHDKSRATVSENPLIKNTHRLLRTCAIESLNDELAAILSHTGSFVTLVSPLAHYSIFAMKYGCELSPTQKFWTDDIPLNDGSTLRLCGLNSTLISDGDDDKPNLVIGSAQANLLRDDGVVYMTLCHHPPNWFREDDQFDEELDSRVHVQLFGHRHRHSVQPTQTRVRIVAGAVHPDRREPGWQPRYNVLRVSVAGGPQRLLTVDLYPRVRGTGGVFGPDYEPGKTDIYRRYQFALPPWQPPSAAPSSPGEPPPSPPRPPPVDPLRRLAYRFLDLPYRQRMEVARKLDLLTDEDGALADPELGRILFARAKERDKLRELWDAVSEKTSANDPNPF